MFSYGFYDSVNHDRAYNADDMCSIFDGVITDGVYAGVGDKLMTTPGVGLQVNVGSGRAWFKKTWSYNSTVTSLTIPPPDVVFSRIDTVVLEVNKQFAVRANSLKIVSGEMAVNPIPATLVNDPSQEIYQYPLAYVTVEPNVKSIAQSKINNRIGFHECPFVTSVLQQTDITTLFGQWNGQFNDWFNGVKNQLSGNIAGNLQNQINERLKISDKATNAEAIAGTNNTKYVTPAALKAAITQPSTLKPDLMLDDPNNAAWIGMAGQSINGSHKLYPSIHGQFGYDPSMFSFNNRMFYGTGVGNGNSVFAGQTGQAWNTSLANVTIGTSTDISIGRRVGLKMRFINTTQVQFIRKDTSVLTKASGVTLKSYVLHGFIAGDSWTMVLVGGWILKILENETIQYVDVSSFIASNTKQVCLLTDYIIWSDASNNRYQRRINNGGTYISLADAVRIGSSDKICTVVSSNGKMGAAFSNNSNRNHIDVYIIQDNGSLTVREISNPQRPQARPTGQDVLYFIGETYPVFIYDRLFIIDRWAQGPLFAAYAITNYSLIGWSGIIGGGAYYNYMPFPVEVTSWIVEITKATNSNQPLFYKFWSHVYTYKQTGNGALGMSIQNGYLTSYEINPGGVAHFCPVNYVNNELGYFPPAMVVTPVRGVISGGYSETTQLSSVHGGSNGYYLVPDLMPNYIYKP